MQVDIQGFKPALCKASWDLRIEEATECFDTFRNIKLSFPRGKDDGLASVILRIFCLEGHRLDQGWESLISNILSRRFSFDKEVRYVQLFDALAVFLKCLNQAINTTLGHSRACKNDLVDSFA